MPKNIIFLDNPPKSDLTHLVNAIKEEANSGCSVKIFERKDELFELLHSGYAPDLMLVDDLFCSDVKRGIPFLERLLKSVNDVPVVVILEVCNAEKIPAILEAGATDVIIRDSNLNKKVTTQIRKMKKLLKLIDHNKTLQRQNEYFRRMELERYKMIGESDEILDVLDKIKRVAQIPRPVLITGERGTGKELVARAIHNLSAGQGKPIVVVNCAAFSEQLLESELFGHEKGAFTNADRQAIGKFEQANGGTLFLDEIGNMSISFQKKIMRTVEYGTFRRVGGASEIKVQTRIVTATNANLQELMKEEKFLPDLYDRLAFEIIHLPTLRERKGDIEVLSKYFLQKFMEEVPTFQGKQLSESAILQLNRYHFPGNVRELKNIIERAVYRDTTNLITPEDIGFLSSDCPNLNTGSFKERVECFEKGLVLKAIEDASGNQAMAARILDISYHQLRYYLKKYT